MPRIVKVQLIEEWLGHKPSTILHLNPFKAQEMIARGVAIAVPEEEDLEQKDLTAPPHDKQVKKAWRK